MARVNNNKESSVRNDKGDNLESKVSNNKENNKEALFSGKKMTIGRPRLVTTRRTI